MVDQTNIFEGSEQNQDQGGVQENQSGIPESLQAYVGDGKKYASVDKALESIAPAQDYIQKLEAELAETRAKVEASTSVEETLKKFQEQKAQETPTSQPVDPKALYQQFKNELLADQQAEIEQANTQEVVSALTEQFGDSAKAKEAFEAKARDLGMSVESLDNLAKQSPRAIFDMFGTSKQPTPKSAMKTSVNSQAFESTQTPSQEPIPGVMYGASSDQVLEAFRKAKNSVQL